jgi:hypothetical protein
LSTLAPDADETIRKVHDRIINGTKVACVEIANQENQSREVCIDELTGAQVRQRPLFDRETMVVAGRVFSRFRSFVENGKPLAQIQLREFKTTDQLSSSAFEPPGGAVSKAGCMNPSAGRVVSKISGT